MQLAAQGFLAMGALINTMIASKEKKIVFGQACKQDIDRGAVMNALTRINMKILGNETLAKEELYDLHAMIFGRSDSVDHRRILAPRFQPFVDLLDLIANDPHAYKKALQDYFSKDIAPMEVRLDFNRFQYELIT
ncbi:MAG: hypothetical protein Tsb0015_01700 [Simkaniaceae bacterium]